MPCSGAQRQQRLRAAPARQHAAGDHGGGAERGQQRGRTREGRGVVVDECRRHDGGKTGPPQRHGEPAGSRPSRPAVRHSAPSSQLPGPGVDAEVRPRGLATVCRDDSHSDTADTAQRSDQAASPASAGGRRRRDPEQQRPDEVELLLHRQRPDVLQRATAASLACW